MHELHSPLFLMLNQQTNNQWPASTSPSMDGVCSCSLLDTPSASCSTSELYFLLINLQSPLIPTQCCSLIPVFDQHLLSSYKGNINLLSLNNFKELDCIVDNSLPQFNFCCCNPLDTPTNSINRTLTMAGCTKTPADWDFMLLWKHLHCFHHIPIFKLTGWTISPNVHFFNIRWKSSKYLIQKNSCCFGVLHATTMTLEITLPFSHATVVNNITWFWFHCTECTSSCDTHV